MLLNANGELAIVLELGDNRAINVEEGNDEWASFWLIMCSDPLHKVLQTNGGLGLRREMMLWEVFIIKDGETLIPPTSY
jgi:hypothetical protein